MTRRAFDKIAEGLHEAVAIAQGRSEPARVHVPNAVDVKALRDTLGLSQEAFAARFGFTVSQIRDWEQGRSRPVGALRAYLTVIAQDPENVIRLLTRAA